MGGWAGALRALLFGESVLCDGVSPSDNGHGLLSSFTWFAFCPFRHGIGKDYAIVVRITGAPLWETSRGKFSPPPDAESAMCIFVERCLICWFFFVGSFCVGEVWFWFYNVFFLIIQI